jgi:hypothetical protein
VPVTFFPSLVSFFPLSLYPFSLIPPALRLTIQHKSCYFKTGYIRSTRTFYSSVGTILPYLRLCYCGL